MKKQISKFFFSLTLIGISSLACLAQAPPQAFSYQAVARDNNGNIISNQTVSLRFTIHDVTVSGTTVYQETQSATTNVLGLVNLSIGIGTVISGTFAGINWGSGPKYLQVEIDPAGGSNYTSLGTSQMLSVPYALYAGNGGSNATISDSVIEVDGTGPVIITSANVSPNWVSVPGLSATVNVPVNSKILIQSAGGVSNESGGGTWVIVDIMLFVDGNLIGTPAFRRIGITNPGGFNGVNGDFGQWNIESVQTLAPGPHTIAIMTEWSQSSNDAVNSASVSDVTGYVNQGQLVISTIQQ